jgi:hypothetical protein
MHPSFRIFEGVLMRHRHGTLEHLRERACATIDAAGTWAVAGVQEGMAAAADRLLAGPSVRLLESSIHYDDPPIGANDRERLIVDID